MNKGMWWTSLSFVICIAGLCAWRITASQRSANIAAVTSSLASPSRWSPQAAARYLDAREDWWQAWPPSHREQGTICISCHTAVPYAIVRPILRKDLGETELTGPEKFLMDSVEKRVGHWSEMTPFYSDAAYGSGKAAQSRATEAVLNAVILASRDSQLGKLSPITRTALEQAWALQEVSGENAGGWKWQDFHLAPWESGESAYQGAAMLALAVGGAPGGYANEPGVREHMERLVNYLRRGYSKQPLMSQLYVLQASSKVPDLLNAIERSELIARTNGLEERDGGWRLAMLNRQPGLRNSLKEAWQQLNKKSESDGVATGLVVFALEGGGSNPEDPVFRRGVEWLEQNQNVDGKWHASSLNGNVDFDSGVGRFMSDAATGYAVLALDNAPKETDKANLGVSR